MKPFWVHTLLRLYITRLHEVFIYNFIKSARGTLDETTCPIARPWRVPPCGGAGCGCPGRGTTLSLVRRRAPGRGPIQKSKNAGRNYTVRMYTIYKTRP